MSATPNWTLTLFIRDSCDEIFALPTERIWQVKQRISQKYRMDQATIGLRTYEAQRELIDEAKTLVEYGIKQDTFLQVYTKSYPIINNPSQQPHSYAVEQ